MLFLWIWLLPSVIAILLFRKIVKDDIVKNKGEFSVEKEDVTTLIVIIFSIFTPIMNFITLFMFLSVLGVFDNAQKKIKRKYNPKTVGKIVKKTLLITDKKK